MMFVYKLETFHQQETVDNWLIYQQKADAFKLMLQEAEAQLLPEELQRITAEELHQQLLDSKVVQIATQVMMMMLMIIKIMMIIIITIIKRLSNT